LPVIFVCENNQYAKTTPQADHQRIKDVANRSLAYDMDSMIIDGNDVVEVYGETSKAVQKAREGGGPTFIECKTYRWRGHWEGDPQPYRTQDEVEVWKQKCPIARFRKYVTEKALLKPEELDRIEEEVGTELQEAIEFARKSPHPDPEEALDDIYTTERR
jgi:pyruvate dehydrogenase E1 component alpha subunit